MTGPDVPSGELRCWDDEPGCNCANAGPHPADVTREPTGGQGLREAAQLLYPGLFPDEAYRRHPGQIDRVAALIADAERVRRVRELVGFYDRHEYSSLNVDDLRRALDGEPQP